MNTFHRLHCGEELNQAPEKERGDWFLRCLSCSARNIITPSSGLSAGWEGD
jgi:hypothetical protein